MSSPSPEKATQNLFGSDKNNKMIEFGSDEHYNNWKKLNGK